MNTFDNIVARHARLAVLRILAKDGTHRVNEEVLMDSFSLYGFSQPPGWKLEQIQAVVELKGATKSEGFPVYSLTEAGHRHLECQTVIEGIARPGH